MTDPGSTSLIGSVIERKPGSSATSAPRFNGSGKSGFPAAQHRSKSAFARAREGQQKNGGFERPQGVPTVMPVANYGPLRRRAEDNGAAESGAENSEGWRQQIEEENLRRVEMMSEEERERERQEVIEKFGADVGDILKKVRQKREAQQKLQNGSKRQVSTSSGLPRLGEEVSDGSTVIQPSPVPGSSKVVREFDVDEDWLQLVGGAKTRSTERMTEEEREQVRRENLERFETGVENVLKQAREAKMTKGKAPRKSSFASRPSSPPGVISATRPPSRTDRHIRFAEVTPQDVHVYESAPPSPRRKPLALPPPSDEDGSTISLGEWKGKMKASIADKEQAPSRESPGHAPYASVGVANNGPWEEGTPEDIRRRFFPSATPNDPSLAWIERSDQSEHMGSTPLRFDLSGTPIPPAVSSTLPTHLGLHHHADGTQAGYTLDDIFLLSRSTVPAQRSSMLDVLGKIARRLARGAKGQDGGIPELAGQEAQLRKRILASGIEAMGERGSLGARAVEIMWVCIVGWDEELTNIEGVELTDNSENDPLASLPMEYLLGQIASAFGAAALPSQSLGQLLAIVHRLAQHSNEIANTIVATPDLVRNLIQHFLLTPIPPKDDIYPEPFALQVLITLASASRSNAVALVDPADALLRFVVTLQSSSPYPSPLSTSLLASTLRFYTTLASYGLYAQIATTAAEHFNKVGQYVLSVNCTSKSLREAWLGLLDAWMVCARDPHRTTPSHEILWSQVVSWGWGEDVLALSRRRLTADDLDCWIATWRALAAWLEGANVNGVRGGEMEKSSALALIRPDFESGVEHAVVDYALAELGGLLHAIPSEGAGIIDRLRAIAKGANIVASALRLWLSALPAPSQGPPTSPPFALPFAQISSVCAKIATLPLWASLHSGQLPSYAQVYFTSLSLLLSTYLDVSRVLPDTSDDLWMAQALTVLCRLLPGHEESGVRFIEGIGRLVNPGFMQWHGWHVPPVIWERKGLEPIIPFLTYALQAAEVYVGPPWMTPLSISRATTQRLPALPSPQSAARKRAPLPLYRDWSFATLDHLLRSGETEVFKSLPSSWDASETEIVRATLLLARVSREVLRLHSLQDSLMSREETVFACMKVFMLEHGQQHQNSTEEVFRDTIVTDFMNDLVAPYTIAASATLTGNKSSDTLETVAIRFLGPSTPFYQWYTDFVGLYDAISFSHPLFARLLLPPLSMRYPPDYRKYLWADYGHVVRTIKTPVEAVIAESVEEFLWPFETNAEIVSAYLRALVRDQAEGFLRFVAVHHVACGIWPDLRGDTGEEKATKLLRAVVDQGGFNVIREVVSYRQVPGTAAVLPPACFEQDGEWKAVRRAFVDRCGGIVKERIEKLL